MRFPSFQFAALALSAFFLAGTATAQETAPPAAAQTVVSLSFVSDGIVDETEVANLVTIRVGEPLTPEATGSTIRNLFETGLFVNIGIEAETVGDGVAVVLRLARAFRVFPLKFSGVPLPREELRRIVGFSEGEPYSKERVDDGAGILKRRLEQEGYLHAQVQTSVRLDPVKFDARVEYRVEKGEQARVAPPFFDGSTEPFTREQLLQKAKLKPGKKYKEAKARGDATRMTEFLHKNSHMKGLVELIAAQPTEDGRLTPVFRVSVGPKVVFVGQGIEGSKVEKEVHSQIEGEVLDEDAILRYVEDKRRYLQEKGFYRAKVDYTIQNTPDAMTVNVTVETGPHYEIEKVEIVGNDSVPEKTLRKFMVVAKKRIPLLRPNHVTDEVLSGDVSALEGYYQTHGWIGARVGKPRVEDGSKPDRLIVTVTIREGPQARVTKRTIEGNEHVEGAVLEKDVTTKLGEPFNPNTVRTDVNNLQSYYHDHGWSSASVRGDYDLSADKTEVAVTYRIEEGPRSFFGKTIVRGNARTRMGRIRRLITWKEGEPFSETDLLATQRNLSRAGVFRRADVRPDPVEPGSQSRNATIELQESLPLSLLYGFGYLYAPDASSNRNDPFLVGGIGYNNLFGNMLTTGIEGQVAISGRYKLQLSFRDPYFLGHDLRYTALIYASREPIQDVDIDRKAIVNEVTKFFGRYWRVSLRADYQRITPVNPEDLSTIEKSTFPRFDQPINEFTFGPQALYDRRDDIIDPHRGYYVTGGVRRAFPIGGADARFTKGSIQAAFFRTVGASVAAVSLRTGGIWPYGPSDIQVPIAERFFAGGPTSSRGFQTDLLGINGKTVDYNTRATPKTGSGPGSCAGQDFANADQFDCSFGPHIVGGNGFLAFNVELRIPFAGNLGADLFYDLAQVWQNASDIRLKFEGEDGLRQSIGFGLHYMLPIGPLRVGLGIPVKPQTIPVKIVDENNNPLSGVVSTTKEKLRFFFSLGYPF